MRTSASVTGLALVLALGANGCGSSATSDQASTALAQERERLVAENQGLEQARADNQEAQRLKQEVQDLPKARSQYQEAIRLRKENAQLEQELARLTHTSRTSTVASADVHAAASTRPPQQETEKKEAVAEETVVNEGDEIMVEPKYLKQLLPDFDWEKLARKEPISIRALMEKDGYMLTNTAQLQEYGITNFVVRRAPPAKPAPTEQRR